MIKKLLLIIGLGIFINCPMFAQTNTNSVSFTDETKKIVQTNLNQVLIEILSGAKDVGGEIYQASKEALGNSVDFVKKEAPEVVTQFLKWKFAESIINASIPLVIIFFLFIAAFIIFMIIKKTLDKEENYTTYYRWIPFAILGVLLLMSCPVWGKVIGDNTLNAVKIKVAPKVYIIEYAIDVIKGKDKK